MKLFHQQTSLIAGLAFAAVWTIASSADAQCQRGQGSQGMSPNSIASGSFMRPMGPRMPMNNPYAVLPQQLNNFSQLSNNSVSMTPAQNRQALQAQYQAKMELIREKKAAIKAANASRRKNKPITSTTKSPVALLSHDHIHAIELS